MGDLLQAFLAGTLATLLPLFIGVVFPRLLDRRWTSPASPGIPLAAFSSGIILWFFLDVMRDAALLDVNKGFGGGYPQVALALLFPISLVALFTVEKIFSSRGGGDPGPQQQATPITLVVASVAALGIGLHALGEGIIIGASIPRFDTILDAIGGLSPGVAYVLHKFLEGFVLGTFALLAQSTTTRKLGVLGAITGVATILGFILGLPGVVGSTYFFAAGAAGAVYIEVKLIPSFSRSPLSFPIIISFLLGFLSMYLAGLFHA